MSTTENPQPRIICVTGMHRSGTSLVARLVNLLGVDFGPEDDLVGPAPDNPTGFWEAEPLRVINDHVLQTLGGSWVHPPPVLEPGWEQAPRLNAHRKSGLEALNHLFDNSPVVAWKDPRLSLTLPFWRTVSPISHTVLVVRSPRDVAASLAKRNGFASEQSAELWLRYVAAAWVNDPHHIKVSYDRVLEEPRGEAMRLAEALGLAEPSADQLKAIDEFVDPELRGSDTDSITTGPRLQLAEAVHAVVCEQPRDVVRPLMEALLSRWRPSPLRAGPVERIEALLNPAGSSAPHIAPVENVLEQIRTEVAATVEDLVLRDADLAERDRQLERAERRKRALQQETTEVEEQLEDRTKRLEEQKRALKTSEQRSKASIDALERSLQSQSEEAAINDARAQRLEADLESNLQSQSEEAAFNDARAQRLEADLERARRRVDRLKNEARQASQSSQAEEQLRRLRNRRSVRLALRLSSLFRPVFRFWRGTIRGGARTKARATSNSQESDERSREPSPSDKSGWVEHEWGRLADALEAKPATSVIIPVFNAHDETKKCVEALLRNTPRDTELVFINDASTDPRIEKLFAEIGQLTNVRILVNEDNRGFVGSVNRGFAATEGDVILLNSDTEVTPMWLQNLTIAAYLDTTTATATAMSDNAGAFSVPEPGVANEYPTNLSNDDVGRLVLQGSARTLPSTPTGNGFCMYIKRAALDTIGHFDEEAFPRGYGEENDFCMKALRSGWTNVVDDATIVFHKREASFGEEKKDLLAKGRATLDDRYPEYGAKVREFMRSERMSQVRERVESVLLSVEDPPRQRVLYVIHDGSGGTPSTNLDLMRAIEHDQDPFLLTSNRQTLKLSRMKDGALQELERARLDDLIGITDIRHDGYRDITTRWLVQYGIELVHVRHLFKHSLDLPRIARALGIPVLMSFHDFYFTCPTVHLLDDQLRFCGGTCTEGDGECLAPSGGTEVPYLKHAWVHVWRDHVRNLFDHVNAFVTTTESSKQIHTEVFPELRERWFEVIEHGRDLTQETTLAKVPNADAPIRIAVLGNLGVHKGALFLKQLKELDEARRLEFHLFGSVPEEFADIGVAHGKYDREQLIPQLSEVRPAFVGLFSIWAETYSHTLTEAWAAGIPVLVSHLGALAERVRHHGGGWIVDVTDPASAYDTILQIANDPDEYQRVAENAHIAGLPTTADMAKEYRRLYQQVVQAASERDAGLNTRQARTVPKTQLFLVGDVERRPASAYVRVLQRFRHPQIAQHVAARSGKVASFLRGSQPPDIAWIQRTAIPAEAVDPFLRRAEVDGIPIVVDLDDHLLDPQVAPTETYAEYADSLKLLLGSAALVIVSTQALAEVTDQFAKRVEVVPNVLDETIWFDGELAKTTRPGSSRQLRVLYMGTKTHAGDLRLLRPVLEQLRRQGRHDVGLTVIGGEPDGPDQDWYYRLRPPKGMTMYPRFVRWLRRQAADFDIAVAPLVDNSFNSYKSELKFLEYSALGLPAIFSAVGSYKEAVLSGETGILVSNEPDAWVSAIEELADVGRRQELGRNAFMHVREDHTLGKSSDEFVSLVRSLMST